MRAPQEDFRVRAADDPPSLLVLILDVSAKSWTSLSSLSGPQVAVEAASVLKSVTEQLLIFLNTFRLLHEGNRVCVILAAPNRAHLVHPAFDDAAHLPSGYDYTTEDAAFDSQAAARASVMYEELAMQQLRHAVVESVKEVMQAQDAQQITAPAAMSTALATALCLHNRARRIKAQRAAISAGQGGESLAVETGPCNGRVFIVTPGRDTPKQYVAVMNCIFSAQRMGVAVDSCVLSKDYDSTYFQQAAHLTNGVYLRPKAFGPNNPDELLQYLQTLFLVDKQNRDFLAMPTPEKVDFRASCMKTRRIIEDGYTCSVCLSTFDTTVVKGAAMCPICNARFAVMPRLGRRPPRP